MLHVFAVAFFVTALAEIGDKAALVTMAVAANSTGPLLAAGRAGIEFGRVLGAVGVAASRLSPAQTFLAIWLGSILGNLASDGVGVMAGSLLGRALPRRVVQVGSAGVFVVLGAIGLAGAFAAWRVG
jgi:putative Ca2+/H+ antiporter (TMEM165/GDT1 family)